MHTWLVYNENLTFLIHRWRLWNYATLFTSKIQGFNFYSLFFQIHTWWRQGNITVLWWPSLSPYVTHTCPILLVVKWRGAQHEICQVRPTHKLKTAGRGWYDMLTHVVMYMTQLWTKLWWDQKKRRHLLDQLPRSCKCHWGKIWTHYEFVENL